MGREPGDAGDSRTAAGRGRAARTGSDEDRAPLGGTLAKALILAVVGAAALVGVGLVLASTGGLLFLSGVTGAGIGLVLARARVPSDGAAAPLSPRAVTRLAIGIALATIVVAGLATWLLARSLGGTLGPIDYLLTTFGPFLPGEAILAALGAAWGARAGPIQR